MKPGWVFVVAVSVLAQGCSIALVDGPRLNASRQVECTESFTVPLIDAVGGVAGIATPLLLEATRDRMKDSANIPLAASLAAAGVVYAVSSVIGVTRVKRCRNVRASEAATAPVAPAPTTPPAP